MKTCVIFAIAATACAAADINIQGAQRAMAPAATDVRVATADILNRPTGLLNKNTLAMDNNVHVARSNVVFSQNDLIKMTKQVEQALNSEEHGTAATLTRSVMRSVSAPDTDSSLMTKASAVVAAKGGDTSTLSQRIADFVKAAAEQSVQTQSDRGMITRVGTKDILRQPTGVINKNVVLSDDQIAMSRTAFTPSQNDQVDMSNAKVADVVAPATSLRVGKINMEQDQADDKKEHFGWGWGYPGWGGWGRWGRWGRWGGWGGWGRGHW
ncbi:hypothetical protein Poli38472_011152 [Pythium oligandrum]|uniref:Uncharacterized protein n=1 Tax=Pythium oligandrum TaxID=41045 RepID=A0A8K1FQ36_PYTOL|nr:hypothetical protein Poli38472_011152 [Pythium oligandrum]|eukprot:TMW67532.1 hypothetical protein Poli38472_011152 [Pythium oligandrum]